MENTNTDARKAAITPAEIFNNKLASISDSQLAVYCQQSLSELCKTGARSFTMSVPPSTKDTDMLFGELIRRFSQYRPATLNKEETPKRIDFVVNILNRNLSFFRSKMKYSRTSQQAQYFKEAIDGIESALIAIESLSEQPESKSTQGEEIKVMCCCYAHLMSGKYCLPECVDKPAESEQVETLINAKNFFWNKSSEKPLVDWNENHTRWVQSNHCPSGEFMAGLYVGNKEIGKYRFEFYKVVLTEDGLREVADDDNFDTGYEIDDFEYWAEVPKPPNH